MSSTRLARDLGLRLDKVDDVMDLLSSGVEGCIFTLDDVSPELFDLKTRLAGEIFQKLVNYNFKVAFVLPVEHGYGDRTTELAREHSSHPVIRFFSSVEEAMLWPDSAK